MKSRSVGRSLIFGIEKVMTDGGHHRQLTNPPPNCPPPSPPQPSMNMVTETDALSLIIPLLDFFLEAVVVSVIYNDVNEWIPDAKDVELHG